MKLAAQLGLEGSPVLHSTNVPSSAPINSLCQKSMVLRFYSIGPESTGALHSAPTQPVLEDVGPLTCQFFFKDDDIDSDRPLRMKTFIPTLSTDCLWQCRRKLSINGKKKCLHHPAHCLAIQAYRKPCCVVVSSIGWAYATACFVMLICL